MTCSYPPFAPRPVRQAPARLLLVLLLMLTLLAALPPAASAQPAPSDTSGDSSRAFPQTGYAIVDDAVWTYFTQRGGVNTFGYPVSREFTLQGAPAQLFQVALLQVQPDGSVRPVNLLGPGYLPYTHFDGLTVPALDPAIQAVAPTQSQPDYGARLIEFVRAVVPDAFQGQPVNFQSTLFGSVSCDAAFPDGNCQSDLLPLMDVEVWGLPTSMPAADPNNPNFVYQRFERGVLMFNASDGTTTWMPMGDALKSLITGKNLAPDLAKDASASPFLLQYDPTRANSLARPDALRDTDMTDAFTPDAETTTG